MSNQDTIAELDKTRAELNRVRAWLDIAIDKVKTWQNEPDKRPSPLEIQEHKDALLMAYARYRILQDKYDGLVLLAQRLLAQKQSAKDAFEVGWKARYTDIVSRLTGTEYADLRRALQRVAEDDAPF